MTFFPAIFTAIAGCLAVAFLLPPMLNCDAQKVKVGNGSNTYQILFSNWSNPQGRVWSGNRCDSVGDKCDTRFTCHTEVFGCNATEKSRINKKEWPGAVKMNDWKTVGKSKYEKNSLKDFATLNLTNVKPSEFCGAILRCQVLDVDPLSNDEIDAYIGRLPGCQELDVPKLQKDARWSDAIDMDSLSDAMPKHKRGKGKPDKAVIKSHKFQVKVRTWGPESTRRTSLSGSSTGSGRRDSSSSSTSSNGRRGGASQSDDMAQRRMHHT